MATEATLPPTKNRRAAKRRFVESASFWALVMPFTVACLLLGSLYFGRETRIEGQVIPPAGTVLSPEVWIVTDFSSLAQGLAEDLAAERKPIAQEIADKQERVRRARADISQHDQRIAFLQGLITAANEDVAFVGERSNAVAQNMTDVVGTQIQTEYDLRSGQFKSALANRAKSLNLKYPAGDTSLSLDDCVIAYRKALSGEMIPPGVDSAKEHQWFETQLGQWRDRRKKLDRLRERLKNKVSQVKAAPAPQVTNHKIEIEDWQRQINGTLSEEAVQHAVLQQALEELETTMTEDANADGKYIQQLETLPASSLLNSRRIPIRADGRFTWIDDEPFLESENRHSFCLFFRASTPDGQQYWALHRLAVERNQTLQIVIEPSGFLSTKAILQIDPSNR